MWCAGTSSWRTRTRYSRWSMAMRRACADSWPVRRTDRRGRLAQGQRARIRRQTGPSPSSGARACSSPLAHGIGRPWTREQPLTRRGRRVVTLADACAVAALRLQLEGGLEDAHEQPRGRVRSGQCRCGLPVPGRVRVSGFGTDLQRPALPGAHRRCRFDYEETDHLELLELLKALPCSVILPGYPSALHDGLPGGWRNLELQVMNQGGVRTEKLWFNFVPDRMHQATPARTSPTDSASSARRRAGVGTAAARTRSSPWPCR